MKKLLEISFDRGIYKGSDKINIGTRPVETRRKEEAEKKLTEILKAFEELIVFVKKRRDRPSNR